VRRLIGPGMIYLLNKAGDPDLVKKISQRMAIIPVKRQLHLWKKTDKRGDYLQSSTDYSGWNGL